MVHRAWCRTRVDPECGVCNCDDEERSVLSSDRHILIRRTIELHCPESENDEKLRILYGYAEEAWLRAMKYLDAELKKIEGDILRGEALTSSLRIRRV